MLCGLFLVAVVTVVLSGCTPSEDEATGTTVDAAAPTAPSSPPTSGSGPSPATLDSDAWPDALITGTLVIEGRCIYLDGRDGRGLAVFPAGAEVDDSSEVATVSFPDGAEIPIAVEVQVGGGVIFSPDLDGLEIEGIQPECNTERIYYASPIGP